MKKRFTLEDMEEAFNAGEQRAMWEESGIRNGGYAPDFAEFMHEYYEAGK